MINILRKIKFLVFSLKNSLKRFFYRSYSSWLNMNKPFSKVFGFDRGCPIDRKFIDDFLLYNSQIIKGSLLEIGDDQYTIKYGSDLQRVVVLAGKGSRKESISFAGDLTNPNSLLSLGRFNCVIATNVLNFIFDFDSAVHGLSTLVNTKSGTVLATVAGGVSQVSRYDYERWGDYWRFSDMSIRKIFQKYFNNVEVQTFGNAPLAAAFIMGLAKEEIPSHLFKIHDPDYQILITIKASLPKL
jgi:hypothetical protein